MKMRSILVLMHEGNTGRIHPVAHRPLPDYSVLPLQSRPVRRCIGTTLAHAHTTKPQYL
jgi:hypothetical protein